MKKFIFLSFLLNLFFITASYAEESAFCCSYITVSSEVTEMCCVRLSVNNPHCYDPTIVFKRYNTTTGQYVTISSQSIGQGQTATQVICPIQGENFVQYRILIQQYNGEPYCPQYSDSLQNPWSFKEGYTQFTGTVDLSNCCKCPDSTLRNSWLNVVINHDRTCPGLGCRVTIASLDIPVDITCYNNYVIEYPNQTMSPLRSLVNNPIAGTNFCIGNNTYSTLKVYLMKGSGFNLDSACVITKPLACDSNTYTDDTTKYSNLCILDCPDSNWVPIIFADLTLPSGCIVKVEYTYRVACAQKYQDLQVTKITKISGCNEDEKSIYKEVIKLLIKYDVMGFNPGRQTVGCDTLWRIINATCWRTDWTINPSNGLGILVLHKCDSSECCIQRYIVCRFSPDSINFTPIGPPTIPTTFNCVTIEPSPFPDPHPWYEFTCHTSCDWLDMEYWPLVPPLPEETEKNIDGDTGDFIHQPDTEKIEVYNLYGVLLGVYIIDKTDDINKISSSSFVQTKGLYLYKSFKNGILIKTGKFIKN